MEEQAKPPRVDMPKDEIHKALVGSYPEKLGTERFLDEMFKRKEETTADIPVADLLKWSDSCAPLPRWYRRRGPQP